MDEKIREYLATHEQDQFRFLQELVLQPSFSKNKWDVNKVGEIILRELADLPLTVTTVEQSRAGDHLLFRSAGCSEKRRSILFVGHMDTVFPPENGFNWFREEDGKAFGPGVIDMKGGLAVAIFALKALHHLGLLAEIPITLLCNSDEEVGSPTSKELITEEAKKGLFGLVFECGGLGGEIVTGRKGKSGFTLDVKGRAGHAAFAGSSKSSAILEMAHKVIAIERLNEPDRQLVVNVGTIEGGIGPNTIPDSASVKIDARYLSRLDGDYCFSSISEITRQCTVAGTSAALMSTSGRPPMEQSEDNQLLFKHVKDVADKLNISVREELRSGVSDANTMAAAGLPVVDGMGPIGDCDHSDREYMIKESMLQKTLLSAVTIVDLWNLHKRGELSFSKKA